MSKVKIIKVEPTAVIELNQDELKALATLLNAGVSATLLNRFGLIDLQRNLMMYSDTDRFPIKEIAK